MSPILPDRNARIGNVRALSLASVSSLITEGYDPRCVAEGLLHAAREMLPDDHELVSVMIGFLQFNSVLAARFKGGLP
jgi:hypothetical protein